MARVNGTHVRSRPVTSLFYMSQTLGLASNAISPRACFVICQGLMQNSSIRDIDLSNNSLGKVGVGYEFPYLTSASPLSKELSCSFNLVCTL